MGDITLNSKLYAFSGVAGKATRYIYRGLGLTRLFSYLTVALTGVQAQKARTSKVGTIIAPAVAGHTKVAWNLRQTSPIVVAEGSCCGEATEAVNTAFITLNISDDADPTVRADFLAQIQALVLKAEFTASVTDLTQPYS